MSFFFFNDTATTEIYTLPLHDALPIYAQTQTGSNPPDMIRPPGTEHDPGQNGQLRDAARPQDELEVGHGASIGGSDRKSTRLNSSHSQISYAVFCLKKKQKL